MSLSNSQKAVLHIAKTQLGLDEESYRAALLAHGGVDTSKRLDYKGFLAVMKHFEASGFTSRGEPGVRPPMPRNRPGMATDGQIRKIKALWLTLDGYYQPGQEWKALRGFIKRVAHVNHENFLTPEMAHNVIEGIKKIQSRRGTACRARTTRQEA